MKTELIDVSSTRKEIKIEFEPAEIRDAYDRISREYSKAAKVPGFRPGHAPTSVVRTRYKREIRSEVLRELLPDAVNNAISEHSLAALGEPDVQLDNNEALERLGEEPLTVKVALEVLPEIELRDYKGLETTRRLRPRPRAPRDRRATRSVRVSRRPLRTEPCPSRQVDATARRFVRCVLTVR